MKYKLALIFLIVGLSGAVYAADPTRFNAGVTTVDNEDLLRMFPLPDPTKVFVFFDDFAGPVENSTSVLAVSEPADIEEVTAIVSPVPGWIMSVTNPNGTAGANGPFSRIDNTRSSSLKITPGRADNDAIAYILGNQINVMEGYTHSTPGVRGVTDAIAPFQFTTGKKLWFKTRIKTSDCKQCDWRIGLTTFAPDIRQVSQQISDGVFFDKGDGVTPINLCIQKGGSVSGSDGSSTGTHAAQTVTEATTSYAEAWTTLGFYYDGGDNVYCAAENANGKLEWNKNRVASTNIPSTTLTIHFGIVNGEAVTANAYSKTMWIDYIFAAQER